MMSTRIISSTITATGNIIAASLSPFIRWRISQVNEHNSFYQTSNARIDKLHKSVWKGEFHVDDREETEIV